MTSPLPDNAQGIDVNLFHPIKDFGALGSAGISFVGVKATEGNTVTDPRFVAHRDGLRQLPLDLVIYFHFARTGSAAMQAARLLSTVGPLQPNERLCLDLEVLPDDPGDVLQWVDDFYGRLRRGAPGRRHFIYTSKRVWSLFGNPDWAGAADVDLWAPRYNTTGAQPLLPKPWETRGWCAWQWTDGDVVPFTAPGVGPCDGNVWRGSRDELHAWVSGQ